MSEISSDKQEVKNITQVAKDFKVASSLLRYWESEFEILNPGRNEKGNRIYTKEDIDDVRTIYHLVKEKGFTLDGARSVLEKDTTAAKEKVELIDSLKEVKDFLEDIKRKAVG